MAKKQVASSRKSGFIIPMVCKLIANGLVKYYGCKDECAFVGLRSELVSFELRESSKEKWKAKQNELN